MRTSTEELLTRLVSIPSVTGEERAAAQWMAERCEAAGFEVRLPEVEPGRPNLVARWTVGRRPMQLLTGHLDTVPVGEGWSRDPFGEREAGRLYGRGACDMKAGLAAMLAAMIGLKERGLEPAGDVVLAAVVGEEEDSAGTRALVSDGVSADRAILGEPTGLKLVRANRGLINYRVTVRGASAHASSPELGRNAIVAASRLILELDAVAARLAELPHPRLGPANLTVGTIKGGTRPYVIPDVCVIEVDRRLNPGETLEQVREEVEGAVEAVRRLTPWLDEVDMEWGAEYLPFEIPAEHELTRAVWNAMRVAGIDPDLAAWRAASDAGFLVHQAGIPCVLFGPGNLEEAAHRPDEFVDLRDVEIARRVYERVLLTP